MDAGGRNLLEEVGGRDLDGIEVRRRDLDDISVDTQYITQDGDRSYESHEYDDESINSEDGTVDRIALLNAVIAKRRKVATVESALFNPDVVFLLAALLDARDLFQVSLTCMTLGWKRANAVDGLSLVEEAARRLFECASEWERSCLRKYPGEGWIELHHHLLMLRSKLTFDQLVGNYIRSGWDKSFIRFKIPKYHSTGHRLSWALCSNHVMRSGKHFAVFTGLTGFSIIGVVRPVQIKTSDLGKGELYSFHPSNQRFWEYLLGQRTARWTDSNVHSCSLSTDGSSFWYDWASNQPGTRIDGFQCNISTALLLDLDVGTLSAYQNGQRLATLKDGLSGDYCWFAATRGSRFSKIAIKRGLAPEEPQGKMTSEKDDGVARYYL